MKKRFILTVLMILAVFTLVACGDDLTTITFAGVDDITLDYDEDFNVLDGVTAIGNDGEDYTDQITYTHVATTIVTDDVLDTTKAGQHTIKYSVEVGDVLAEKFRFITVSDPVAEEGEMLVNPDFSDGTMGWVDNKAYFVDQAALTLTTEEIDGNPVLKAEVTAGWEPVRPRFGQLNIPFEEGKTYEISFDAKSSVDKTIAIQVGELLDAAPWIVDFIVPSVRKVAISTEWETYSFKFTMNFDNQNGGILLGLGAVDGETIDATMWFDNFAVTETTPDEDLTAPVLSGIEANKSILVNSEFDPFNGVSALDNQDGNVTDKIKLVIFKNSTIVTEVDTTSEANYLLVYSVTDKAGNRQRVEMKLEVVGMKFSDDNLVANPSFEAELDATTPEWGVWAQDWDAAPVVVTELDTTAGTYSLDITGGGVAAWAVQFSQAGYITLVEGSTYRLTAVVEAEVARKMNVAVGYGDPWVEYARFNGVEVLTEETTIELLFTVKNATHGVNIVFELGTQDGFADGLVTFSEVKLQEALLDDVNMNSQINDGWTLWHQDGFWATAAPNVTYDRANGSFNIGTDVGGDDFWAIQFNQNLELEADTTYTLTFDASATAARNINVEVLGTDLLGDAKGDFDLTTTMQTFTVDFTATDAASFMLSFELGATSAFAAGTVSLDNISIKEKDVAEAPELIVNGDATTVPYFMYDNAGEGQGTMVLSEDGDAVVDVTTLGSQAYTPHFYQMIDSLAPGNYVLKIVLDSTVDRDLRINMVLPNADYASIFEDGFVDFEVLSTETNVVYVEFTVTAEVTNVKLELDFGTLGGELTSAIGVFTIQEVLVYQDFN